jgi:hypothetical protein
MVRDASNPLYLPLPLAFDIGSYPSVESRLIRCTYIIDIEFKSNSAVYVVTALYSTAFYSNLSLVDTSCAIYDFMYGTSRIEMECLFFLWCIATPKQLLSNSRATNQLLSIA